jgi:RND family efflux transporter MFP subunit
MRTRIVIFCSVLIIAAATNGCSTRGAEEESKRNEKQDDEVVFPAVKVIRSNPGENLQIPGELMSYYETDVYPKVNSYIRKMNVDIGDKVHLGQVLAELEAPELTAQLAEAYAKVRSFEAQMIASKAIYRRLLVAANTKGAVSPNDMDVARSKIVADSLSLLGANAVYQAHQEMISYLRIKAPFDGIITDRKLAPGAFVGPADKSAVPMYRIKQESMLRLQVAIPERYTDAIREKQPISFSVVSLPGQMFKGKINRVTHNIDRQTRSELVEIQVMNPGQRLAPGMYAQVVLPVGRSHSSLIVPSSAVSTTMEKCFVIRIDNGRANWIDVKKGMESGGKTEIFGPVKDGDTVLKTANDEIPQGQQVKIAYSDF